MAAWAPVSKACLSCHDGTIALDSYGGNSGSTLIDPGAEIGIDLSGHHPIGMDWLHQTVDGSCSGCHGLHGGTFTLKNVLAYDGKIECASCHDAHNGTNLPKLVRVTMIASELCITCHTDK
jgi:predicted CXXCH cytochrome family protein